MLSIIKFIILDLWSFGGYAGYFWYPILPKQSEFITVCAILSPLGGYMEGVPHSSRISQGEEF